MRSTRFKSLVHPLLLLGLYLLALVAALSLASGRGAMLAVAALGALGLLLTHRLMAAGRAADAAQGHAERYAELGTVLSGDAHLFLELPGLACLYASPGLPILLGCDSTLLADEEAFGLATLVHGEDLPGLREDLETLARSRPPAEGGTEAVLERTVKTSGPEVRWVRFRMLVFLRDREGRPEEALLAVRDVTAWMEAEAALLRAQEQESLGTLTREVIHDLNNTLMGVQGQTELALGLEGGDPALALRGLHAGVLRASQYCRQLLSYAGRGQVNRVPHPLNRSVEEARAALDNLLPEAVDLVLDLAGDLPPVLADPAQVQHALLHMAACAMASLGQREGTLTLRTRRCRLGLAVGDAPEGLEGDYACLEVEDDGQGMPGEALEALLSRRELPGHPSQGLGLLALKWIAREHAGALDVQSREGRGTCLRLLLPFAEVGRESDGATAGEPACEGTVLVVDDEATLRTVLRMGLEQAGFRVLEAADGVEGFGAFVRHRTSIDAILLDYTMPRMNGDQLFEEIRKLDATMPVILMSGYSEAEATASLAGRGLSGFLSKPSSLREVLATISRAMAARGAEG